jgi:hypothetical protein
MTLRLMKASATVLWTVGVFALFALLARRASMPDGVAMATLVLLPPILVWFWWHDPEPTMSQCIHDVRDGTSSHAPARRD